MPVFQYIAWASVFVGLFTPRLIVALPALAAIGCGIVSLARKEPRATLSVIAIGIAILFVMAS
jgi:hypothetical protein